MMVETVYNSDDVFREAFAVFNSMRESSEHIDLVLRGDSEADLEAPGGIPCLVTGWCWPRCLRTSEPCSGARRPRVRRSGYTGWTRTLSTPSSTTATQVRGVALLIMSILHNKIE